MSKWITLEVWLERTYDEPRPSIFTARRWAKQGKFMPRAEKHGRTFYVREDARYSKTGDQPRLIDRLRMQELEKSRQR